jgi:hypothetical protein
VTISLPPALLENRSDESEIFSLINALRRRLAGLFPTYPVATGVVQSSGGTLAGYPLTARQILFGGASTLIDQDADLAWDGTTLLVGAATPSTSRVAISRSQDADTNVVVANANTGTSASATVFTATTEDMTGVQTGIVQYGSAYATVGLLAANVGELLHSGGTGNLLITQGQAAGDIVFTTTGSRTERARIANGGNVSIANLTAGGMVKATAATGVLGIATAGTDYVQTVSVTAPITNTGTAANPNIGHATTAVTPASYTYASLTVDSGGHLTAASNGATPEVPLTFSTGLTRAVNTITANISTGLAGGQTAYGGTAASENLTLQSTTNATRGSILFGGAATSGFNENLGQLFVGSAGGLSTAPFVVTSSSDSTIHHMLGNTSTGTAARTGLFVGNVTSSVSGQYVELLTYGTNYTTSGLQAANVGELLHVGAAALLISNSAGDVVVTTSARTERMRVTSGGDITVGTGLATGATAGWLYLSSSAGVPTGVSTSYSAGAVVPYHDDRTNKRLYRNVPGSGTWDIVGQYIGALATDAVLKHSGGGVIGAATSANIAAAITWPTAAQVLVSSGTTTAPVGDAHFTYDTGTDLLTIADGGTQAWYNLDGANYERVRAYWDGSSIFHLAAEMGGSGSLRAFYVESPNVVLAASLSSAYLAVATGGGIWNHQPTVASATSASLDAIQLLTGATITGSTAITTAGGFNGIRVYAPSYSGSMAVSFAATMHIDGAPSISGGGSITNAYALWVDAGLSRFDGNGTHVFELPADATGNVSAAVGRIPVTIGGATRYLRYYTD